MDAHPEPTLVEFMRYNAWATQQVLAACLDLSEEQLTTKAPGAYGTIRETFRHMLHAEADYINRITGNFVQPAFQWEDNPNLADIKTYATQVGEAFLDVVQRVPADQIVREEEGPFWVEYTARQLYMQVVNHGIEHRTNITTLLSSYGLPTPEIDNWGYMWTHTDRFAAREGKLNEDKG